MGLIDSPMLRVLTGSLDANAFRQRVIASNLANVDTPGYKTRDIDFRGALALAVAVAGSEGGLTPVARKLPGLIERPDGNNVSADREGLLLASTQLRFSLSAQLVKDEFHKILSAIREGA
jgi:flagellar basal-body rod protein FlgB